MISVDLIDKLQLFEQMYDLMRIVDPVQKHVLEVSDDTICTKEAACFAYYNRTTFCENCASMRAYNRNESIIKIEHSGEQISLLTAIPVEVDGQKYVVELIKDASNSLYLEEGDPDQATKLLTILENVNKAAIKDKLTKLYNRRFIDERLPVELLQAHKRQEPLSVIFADIDHFKKINDTYGHLVGDQVLQQFAKELESQVRQGVDWVARYGGEEFLLCLPNTDLEQARKIAERIRERIAEKEFVIDDLIIRLTSSFGVHAVCSQDQCFTVEGILKFADQNLYQAKAQGRNRVV